MPEDLSAELRTFAWTSTLSSGDAAAKLFGVERPGRSQHAAEQKNGEKTDMTGLYRKYQDPLRGAQWKPIGSVG